LFGPNVPKKLSTRLLIVKLLLRHYT